jgi:hypothetical protein
MVLLWSLFLLFGCKTNSKGKILPLKSKYVVEYVNMNTTAISSVNCELFATAFGSLIEQKKFYEGNKYFDFIDSSFSFFQLVEEKNIDVRLKMTLTKGDSAKVICMDRFGTFYDSASQKFCKNEPLKKVLFEIIN